MTSLQTEFDFEHELPAGREFFRLPELAAQFPKVPSLLGCSVRHILNLIEEGKLRGVVDLRLPGMSKAMFRIPRAVMVSFLNARKAGAAVRLPIVDFTRDLRPGRETLRVSEISMLLRCSEDHIHRLIDCRAITATDLARTASRSMRRIPRSAFIHFLIQRRSA